MNFPNSSKFTPYQLEWNDFKLDTEQPEKLSEDSILHIEQVAEVNLRGKEVYIYVPSSGNISNKDVFLHLINKGLDWIQQHMESILDKIVEELFDDAWDENPDLDEETFKERLDLTQIYFDKDGSYNIPFGDDDMFEDHTIMYDADFNHETKAIYLFG